MSRRTETKGEEKSLTESATATATEEEGFVSAAEGASPDVAPTGVAEGGGVWERLSEETGRSQGRSEVGRGNRLEKFLILDRLAAGGMGVVFAAHDPNLDRKVAIKVLRDEGGSERARRARRIRLQREAQAAAKLAHPNVITVHEVGVVDGQVFVAMELVDGTTLGEWVRTQKPRWREIVAKYIEAARGLMAAHAAGLVHRDFKPTNVLVGRDGRVRVTDFGLVGIFADTSGAEGEADTTAAGDSVLGAALTAAGQVMGTPRYMAPEQHRGEKVDARADQFSFCVSLYEALYGERPFSEAGGRDELVANVWAAAIRDAPAGSRIPTWIRRVLVRGLSARPEDRYPDMAAVIDALEEDPAFARRRVGLVAGVVLLAAVSVFAFVRGFGRDRGALCEGADDKLVGVWDAAVKEKARVGFAKTGIPYAADTFARTAQALNRYTEAWVAMRTEACEATHVRGEQSEQLLDARMACLDRRLSEVRALANLFATREDKDVVDSAVRAALELTPLSGCADREALLAAVPLPTDPAVRKKVAALRARLDDADALRKAGKYADGIRIAEAVRDEAATIDYKPLLAEALYTLGHAQSRSSRGEAAEESLRAAARTAAFAKDDQLIAKAWTTLVFAIGDRQARYDDALALAEFASVAIRRSGNDPALRGDLLRFQAVVLKDQGKYEESRDLQERAIAILKRAYGDEHPLVATAFTTFGNTCLLAGQNELAEQAYRQALAIFTTAYGPEHIRVTYPLEGLAAALSHEDPKAALSYAERELQIREQTLDPHDPDIASALNIAGTVLLNLGQYDRARKYLERSCRIWERALGHDHPEVAQPLFYLGYALFGLGKYGEAERRAAQALAIQERALGPNHPKIAATLALLASISVRAKRWDEAEARMQRALEIIQNALGAESPSTVPYMATLGSLAVERKQWKKSLTICRTAQSIIEKNAQEDAAQTLDILDCIGRAQIGLGRGEDAVTTLERAQQMVSRPGLRDAAELWLVCGVSFDLARALWKSGRDRQRALQLAKQARSDLIQDSSEDGKLLRVEVDAWLAKRGVR